MVKYRVKTKDGRTVVMAKFSRDEEISEREIELLTRRYIRGLFKPRIVRKNLLEYTGPICISLNEHLKTPMSKYEFFFLAAQVVGVARKIQGSNLFLNKVVFDLRYVFINKTTRELQFLYTPVVSNLVTTDILEFIRSMAYSVKPENGQNPDYLLKFARFIQSRSGFNPDEIETYISREEKGAVSRLRQLNKGQSGFMTDKRLDYYSHYDGDEAGTKLLHEEEDTSLLNQEDDEGTVLLRSGRGESDFGDFDGYQDNTGRRFGRNEGYFGQEDNTTLLDEEYSGTTLLQEEEEGTTILLDESGDTDVLGRPNRQARRYPRLTRTRTQETVAVDKPVFRLGKERSYVDFFVTNNNAVSRSHADIITRGDRYFVKDLNSKNKTYINGTPLQANVETEIFDGDYLTLANEEFAFNT